jgi:hypothetical protein
MEIRLNLPVVLLEAEMLRIPLASMSKVTTTRGGRNTGEFESAKQVVVFHASTFAFVDLHQDTRLIVRARREDICIRVHNIECDH